MRPDLPPFRTAAQWAYVAGMVLVTILSLWPKPDFGVDVPNSDKVAHLVAYGMIGCAGALGQATVRGQAIVIGLAIWLGITLELAQFYVPGRAANVLDGVLNIVGAFLGLALARWLSRRWIA